MVPSRVQLRPFSFLGSVIAVLAVMLVLPFPGATADKEEIQQKIVEAYQQQIFQAVQRDSAEWIKKIIHNAAEADKNIAAAVGATEKKARDQVINAIGTGGQTPLMHAVLSGKTSAVQALVDEGADATIGEKDGFTPMHGAGFQGRAEIAKILLLQAGLDPLDVSERDGYIGMHRACWGNEQRHTDTVQVMVEVGRVPYDYPARKTGKTCLDMTKNKATRKYLLNQRKLKEQQKDKRFQEEL